MGFMDTIKSQVSKQVSQRLNKGGGTDSSQTRGTGGTVGKNRRIRVPRRNQPGQRP